MRISGSRSLDSRPQTFDAGAVESPKVSHLELRLKELESELYQTLLPRVAAKKHRSRRWDSSDDRFSAANTLLARIRTSGASPVSPSPEDRALDRTMAGKRDSVAPWTADSMRVFNENESVPQTSPQNAQSSPIGSPTFNRAPEFFVRLSRNSRRVALKIREQELSPTTEAEEDLETCFKPFLEARTRRVATRRKMEASWETEAEAVKKHVASPESQLNLVVHPVALGEISDHEMVVEDDHPVNLQGMQSRLHRFNEICRNSTINRRIILPKNSEKIDRHKQRNPRMLAEKPFLEEEGRSILPRLYETDIVAHDESGLGPGNIPENLDNSLSHFSPYLGLDNEAHLYQPRTWGECEPALVSTVMGLASSPDMLLIRHSRQTGRLFTGSVAAVKRNESKAAGKDDVPLLFTHKSIKNSVLEAARNMSSEKMKELAKRNKKLAKGRFSDLRPAPEPVIGR